VSPNWRGGGAAGGGDLGLREATVSQAMGQQQSSLGSHSHEKKRLRFCLSAQFRSFDDNQRLSSGPRNWQPPGSKHH